MLRIQKNVPPPPRALMKGRQIKYPFADMEVGDMFFAPGAQRKIVGPSAWRQGKALKRTFVAVAVLMRASGDVWVPCSADDPEAVAGVGVWRTA